LGLGLGLDLSSNRNQKPKKNKYQTQKPPKNKYQNQNPKKLKRNRLFGLSHEKNDEKKNYELMSAKKSGHEKILKVLNYFKGSC
jgi:hypothetical protein